VLLTKVRAGLAIFFAAPIRLNFLSLANYRSLLMNRLRLRTGEDFLKPRIIAQRVPFPVSPQIGKRDQSQLIGEYSSFATCSAEATARQLAEA
jgi:hypothetical protein